MTEDEQIWGKFRMGDKAATSRIYYQHVETLFRYGKKFTNDEELVKDTIQELFFDLIRTRENLGKTDCIRFYLIKAFRRRILAELQKKPNARPAGESDQSIHPFNMIYSYEEELIDRENLSQREKLVQKSLKELSPKQREILYYRFSCDLAYDQICELMAIKYDSARKMVFRALQSLKSSLSGRNIPLLYCLFSKRYVFS